jgi:hypothetical protein
MEWIPSFSLHPKKLTRLENARLICVGSIFMPSYGGSLGKTKLILTFRTIALRGRLRILGFFRTSPPVALWWPIARKRVTCSPPSVTGHDLMIR